MLFLAPYDGYDGDINVEFESEGSDCASTVTLTPIGVYTIKKPMQNCNGDSKLNSNIYIKRDDSDEPVDINTSCASALYIGQVIDGKYQVVGYCNDDWTCGIDTPK